MTCRWRPQRSSRPELKLSLTSRNTIILQSRHKGPTKRKPTYRPVLFLWRRDWLVIPWTQRKRRHIFSYAKLSVIDVTELGHHCPSNSYQWGIWGLFPGSSNALRSGWAEQQSHLRFHQKHDLASLTFVNNIRLWREFLHIGHCYVSL